MPDLEAKKAACHPRPLFILVAGPPASGKSTLARGLAPLLGLPLLAKDTIKGALIAAGGEPEGLEASRALGRAAVLAMLAVARSNTGAVLDSTWLPYAVPAAADLPGTIVEVRCRCPEAVVEARHAARLARLPASHLAARRSASERAAAAGADPLGLGPVVEVDTEHPVELAAVVARIESALRRPASDRLPPRARP